MHAVHPPAMMAEVPNATASAPRHNASTASTPFRIPPISTISMSWRRPISSSASIASMSTDREVMALARTHRLTAYDANYLALAIREGCALASLDRRLNEAAAAEGVLRFA